MTYFHSVYSLQPHFPGLSCRVRPLSESVNDLFREVSLLQKRITELTHRLATLEPFLRRHGYKRVGEEAGADAGASLASPQSLRGEEAVTTLARYPAREQQQQNAARRATPSRRSRVVSRRKVRVLKHGGGVRMLRSER